MAELKFKVTLCNILWQKQDEKEFDNFIDAWSFAKENADKGLTKLWFSAKTSEKKMQYMSKFFKVPDTGKFHLTGNGFDSNLVLDTVDQIASEIEALIERNSQ